MIVCLSHWISVAVSVISLLVICSLVNGDTVPITEPVTSHGRSETTKVSATSRVKYAGAMVSPSTKIVEYNSVTQPAPTSPKTKTVNLEWTVDEMPDPRKCPSCCGISQPGWLCDPNGILNVRTNQGITLADELNFILWDAVNYSVCPCSGGYCPTWNVTLFVAVVRKLNNPNNLTSGDLIREFASGLQKKYWKEGNTPCEREIVIAVSIDDGLISTVLGNDITGSRMMRYDDVRLVGGFLQTVDTGHFYDNVKMLVQIYSKYIDHPVTQTLPPYNISTNATVVPYENPEQETVFTPTVIGLITAAIVFVFIALAIAIFPSSRRMSKNLCRKRKKPSK